MSKPLSAMNDKGHPVDWWFIYKLPNDAPHTGKGNPSTGYEYLYFDSESTGSLSLSPTMINAREGALYTTLQQLYPTKANPNHSLGWIIYNDEIPPLPGEKIEDNDELGHTKGVLAFDAATDTAFWLLHSTPRFLLTSDADFPVDERVYAQTYLCVTLKDVATASAIAAVMSHQQEPQVYCHQVPTALAHDANLSGLVEKLQVSDKTPPSDTIFHSKGGKEFRLIAKNRHWNDDFWNDLVGPRLGVNLNVETWRRGTLAGTEDSDKQHDVVDVLYVNLDPVGVGYEWHYTKDHAKWAVSEDPLWVCIADINRDKSQAKRGGGSICFQDKKLARSLASIEITKKLSTTQSQ